MERVFGFEILPAPFVVAHLQLGLFLQRHGATLDDKQHERAGGLPDQRPHRLGAADRAEADAAVPGTGGGARHGRPGQAGGADPRGPRQSALQRLRRPARRRRSATWSSRTARPKTAPKPQGQGLNDLYVRFFRMAERCIAERHAAARHRLLHLELLLARRPLAHRHARAVPGRVRPDLDRLPQRRQVQDRQDDARRQAGPSVFRTAHNREGIQVGTAIATLVRKTKHTPANIVRFRDFWGTGEAAGTAGVRREVSRTSTIRVAPTRIGSTVHGDGCNCRLFMWPRSAGTAPRHFRRQDQPRRFPRQHRSGRRSSRRLLAYFDPKIVERGNSSTYTRCNGEIEWLRSAATRANVSRKRGMADNIVRYAYRPLDVRWLYWEPETKLVDRNRAEYRPHVRSGTHPLHSAKAKARVGAATSRPVDGVPRFDR